MKALVPFSLPISGLRDGMHTFRFEVDEEFFQCFEGSVIHESNLVVVLTLDKRPSLMVLQFEFEGTVRVECDRCLEPFDLPIKAAQDLLVKYDEEPREEAEVIYIEKGTPSLSVAKYVYEFIHLAVPLHKTHDEAGAECDPEMMQFISKQEDFPEEPDAENPADSIWSDLKKKWSDN
ncbi:MAG: DUF177 domain-containing protein [Lewinellaceae bacterium]|nr:DUF177 domain-containing protein [Lewinellaceae bacterium]